MKTSTTKKFLCILALLLCVIGLAGFGLMITCEILSACGVRFVSSRLLLPLSNLNYDVSEDGKVCCFLGDYHRIQLHDNNGHLLTGWFLRSHKNGEIYIESERIYFADYSDNYFVFDLRGKKIESRKRVGGLSELRSKKERKGGAEKNYKLINTIWDSKITKSMNEQEGATIIKTPFVLLPLRLLTPCIFICIVGSGIMYSVRRDILDAVEERQKKPSE